MKLNVSGPGCGSSSKSSYESKPLETIFFQNVIHFQAPLVIHHVPARRENVTRPLASPMTAKRRADAFGVTVSRKPRLAQRRYSAAMMVMNFAGLSP